MERITNQKLKILEKLQEVKTHPTVEQIYGAVKEELPAISLATVYRNLNLLAEKGEVLRLEINQEYHFDGDVSSHQHCVCNSCGKIMDLFKDEISLSALKNISSKSFSPQRVEIIFYGTCAGCK